MTLSSHFGLWEIVCTMDAQYDHRVAQIDKDQEAFNKEREAFQAFVGKRNDIRRGQRCLNRL
jgi:hypothetical protein